MADASVPSMDSLQEVPAFLMLECPALCQHFTCSLSSAEERGRRVDSLDLLVTVLLRHPRLMLDIFATGAYCCLMASLLSIRTPRDFPVKLFSSQLDSRLYGAWGSHKVQDFALLFIELHRVPVCFFPQAPEVPLNNTTTLCFSHSEPQLCFSQHFSVF